MKKRRNWIIKKYQEFTWQLRKMSKINALVVPIRDSWHGTMLELNG